MKIRLLPFLALAGVLILPSEMISHASLATSVDAHAVFYTQEVLSTALEISMRQPLVGRQTRARLVELEAVAARHLDAVNLSGGLQLHLLGVPLHLARKIVHTSGLAMRFPVWREFREAVGAFNAEFIHWLFLHSIPAHTVSDADERAVKRLQEMSPEDFQRFGKAEWPEASIRKQKLIDLQAFIKANGQHIRSLIDLIRPLGWNEDQLLDLLDFMGIPSGELRAQREARRILQPQTDLWTAETRAANIAEHNLFLAERAKANAEMKQKEDAFARLTHGFSMERLTRILRREYRMDYEILVMPGRPSNALVILHYYDRDRTDSARQEIGTLVLAPTFKRGASLALVESGSVTWPRIVEALVDHVTSEGVSVLRTSSRSMLGPATLNYYRAAFRLQEEWGRRSSLTDARLAADYESIRREGRLRRGPLTEVCVQLGVLNSDRLAALDRTAQERAFERAFIVPLHGLVRELEKRPELEWRIDPLGSTRNFAITIKAYSANLGQRRDPIGYFVLYMTAKGTYQLLESVRDSAQDFRWPDGLQTLGLGILHQQGRDYPKVVPFRVEDFNQAAKYAAAASFASERMGRRTAAVDQALLLSDVSSEWNIRVSDLLDQLRAEKILPVRDVNRLRQQFERWDRSAYVPRVSREDVSGHQQSSARTIELARRRLRSALRVAHAGALDIRTTTLLFEKRLKDDQLIKGLRIAYQDIYKYLRHHAAYGTPILYANWSQAVRRALAPELIIGQYAPNSLVRQNSHLEFLIRAA